MKPDTFIMRRAPAPIGAPFKTSLVPADEATDAALAKLGIGDTVTLKPARHRSTPQQRLYWGLLQHVGEASVFETAERLHVALKIRLGFFDLLRLPNGKSVPVPQSTAFDKMDQQQFQDYFDKALGLICQEVIPGTDSAALIAEVEAMLGINGGSDR